MKPIGIDSINENSKEITNDDLSRHISNKEIINIIDENISIKNRPQFLKLLGGSKVPKNEIKRLLIEIQKILKDHDIKS
jgi:beta-N-acetylglucosaminidase